MNYMEKYGISDFSIVTHRCCQIDYQLPLSLFLSLYARVLVPFHEYSQHLSSFPAVGYTSTRLGGSELTKHDPCCVDEWLK